RRKVSLHRVAPFPVAVIGELIAAARRAAEVRVQHREAVILDALRRRDVAPRIPSPRPAVRHDDPQETMRLCAFTQRRVPLNPEPTARRAARRPPAVPAALRLSAASGTPESRAHRRTRSESASWTRDARAAGARVSRTAA